MQEQHQGGALSQLIGDRPWPHESPSLRHKVVRKSRSLDGRGTWHATHLWVCKGLVLIQSPHTLLEMRGQPYN